jgi:phosphoenolpyruvate carboxykinase (ATP)
MLGETTGTSAGGRAEEGKALRIPGTNPFFPRRHADMGNRFLELLDGHELKVFLLNTGSVGGKADDERAKKLTIADSAALVEGIVTGSIDWELDRDFGYEVATACPGIDDPEKLQPRRLYRRQGRDHEYDEIVDRLKRERREFLGRFPDLAEEIVKSVG